MSDCLELSDRRGQSRVSGRQRRNATLRQASFERRQSECDLLQTVELFANSSQAMMIADARRLILMVNDAFTEISGYARQEVLQRDIAVFQHQDADNGVSQEIWRALKTRGKWQGQLMKRRKNGEIYAAWETIDVVRDAHGRVQRYIALFSDITPLNQSYNRLHYLAHHDCLTGLANRLLFWARLEQSIEKAHRHRRQIALLSLDLDGFKLINDRLGHSAGDQLLKLVAARLRGKVRREDTIARLGGDEFAVIIEELAAPRDAPALAAELGAEIKRPLALEGECLRITASVGIALYPDDAQTPVALYKTADARMYEVKGATR